MWFESGGVAGVIENGQYLAVVSTERGLLIGNTLHVQWET